MAEKFSFVVNGAAVDVSVERDTPLLYILRNDLDLKGTRFGCGDGLCGSCTVIVDGRAAMSCDMPVGSVAGCRVETVEGLERDGEPHPLQRAVLDEQAGQCGYCLSGIIMRAKVLLDEVPRPSRAEIASALDGNLCRCGSHQRIMKAVERAAAALSVSERT